MIGVRLPIAGHDLVLTAGGQALKSGVQVEIRVLTEIAAFHRGKGSAPQLEFGTALVGPDIPAGPRSLKLLAVFPARNKFPAE